MSASRTVVIAIDDSEHSEHAFDCKYDYLLKKVFPHFHIHTCIIMMITTIFFLSSLSTKLHRLPHLSCPPCLYSCMYMCIIMFGFAEYHHKITPLTSRIRLTQTRFTI